MAEAPKETQQERQPLRLSDRIENHRKEVQYLIKQGGEHPRYEFKRAVSLSRENLFDRQTYEISMLPSVRQDKVVPDSFRIILNQYLKKEEAKSLGPDGKPCTKTTRGLLGRTRIVARKIIPVGKETDRKREHGGDPSMLDPRIHVHETEGKMCVADPSDRKRWSKMGVRRLIKISGLSPTTVYKILGREPVRC